MDRQTDAFLKSLDNERNKIFYTRINILDKFDKIITSIEGRVQPGSSISINGSSSVRRTCSLNLVADEKENDLTDIDNILSINKKIRIFIGIEKYIDYLKDVEYYNDKNSGHTYDINKPFEYGFPQTGVIGKIYVDRKTSKPWIWNGRDYQRINNIFDYESDIAWFPLGVFVISQPSITRNASGCNISINCKDKMCLLNGEMGGTFPAPVNFGKYDQIIGERECSGDPEFDNTIEPNDYTVYHYKENNEDKYKIWDKRLGWEESTKDKIGETKNRPQLISDIVRTVVINYGNEAAGHVIVNDIPLEIKQSLRYTGGKIYYDPAEEDPYKKYSLEQPSSSTYLEFDMNEDIGYASYTDFIYPDQSNGLIANAGENVCSVLDKIKNVLGNYEYFYDVNGNFIFQEIRNYLNTMYDKDKEQNNTITYYLEDGRSKGVTLQTNYLRVIGNENYKVDICEDRKSVYAFEENTGLISSYSNTPNYSNIKNDFHILGKNSGGKEVHYHLALKKKPDQSEFRPREVIFLKDKDGKYTGQLRLAGAADDRTSANSDYVSNYIPQDWRAELYLRGLETAQAGGRPDIYEQELIDLFDQIYEWGYVNEEDKLIPEGRFKGDVNSPNNLVYWVDFLDPIDKFQGTFVDDINTKIHSEQKDKMNRIYSAEIPDCVIINDSMSEGYKQELIKECEDKHQNYAIVNEDFYKNLADNTLGYSAEEFVRELLYKHTSYTESISISCMPIYYLEVNRRITVKDKKSGIKGDYIINSITLPLDPNGSMSISASRAMDRI